MENINLAAAAGTRPGTGTANEFRRASHEQKISSASLFFKTLQVLSLQGLTENKRLERQPSESIG